jgi:hypothetical protein
VQPFTVILTTLLVNARQTPRLPYLSVEEEVGSRGIWGVAVQSSQMERGLDAQSFSLIGESSFGSGVVVGLIGVDEVSGHLVGSSLGKGTMEFGEGGRREEEFVMLDVLVEGEKVFFGGGVVGCEEVEVEVVLLDGDAQHEAYTAHK